jgi:hypothetical protein
MWERARVITPYNFAYTLTLCPRLLWRARGCKSGEKDLGQRQSGLHEACHASPQRGLCGSTTWHPTGRLVVHGRGGRCTRDRQPCRGLGFTPSTPQHDQLTRMSKTTGQGQHVYEVKGLEGVGLYHACSKLSHNVAWRDDGKASRLV